MTESMFIDRKFQDNSITNQKYLMLPMPDGFMEQWIAITLARGSDEVVEHFMRLESVKEWFSKKGLSPWMFPERKPWWKRLLRI